MLKGHNAALCGCIVMPTRIHARPAIRASKPLSHNNGPVSLMAARQVRRRDYQWRNTYPGFIHGGEYCISDWTCVIIKPGDIGEIIILHYWDTAVTALHHRWKHVTFFYYEKAYFRWSSIMQLASSMAVGLAMFLSAILFPVFLVAWDVEKTRKRQNSESTSCWQTWVTYFSFFQKQRGHWPFQRQRRHGHN